MSDLREQLQQAIGDAYAIERELGGGGMSRVFVAEETRLGRKVVIKVLPPDMAAAVSVERFEREIKLAARLQHPHIVQLLTAGASDDFIYYMMPFIEGQSLRELIQRKGEMPVKDAVKVLREVADALAYAHRNGVVHRDIKPDNVLLSEGHAVVTDFGVAKALSSSTEETKITTLGVALGTPAYMAPEQAVADPNIDHRADIYALGAMAYEMLTGQPPFNGPSPQAVLSQHVTEAAEQVTKHRNAVPEVLNIVVMRCLEKKAADRFQTADEMLPLLEAVLTPSGGMTPTGTQPLAAAPSAATTPATSASAITPADTVALVAAAHPVRVAWLFALASAGVLAIVYALVQALGLPSWVFVGAIGLLAVGFPIMVLTGHHERRRAMAHSTGEHPTPAGIASHFRWRKAFIGGGVAFGGLAVVTAAFMASRVLGIGPGATLVSSGAFGEQETLILSEFVHQGGDSALATAVTELFNVDLGQSPVVRLMAPGDVNAVLARMERDAVPSLSYEVAREIAGREGVKAVIAGEINPIGNGAMISVRLVSPTDEAQLVQLRETAGSADDILPAIERLSRRLRERIGESLRSVRAAEPLERVTTSSMEALALYSRGVRMHDFLGEGEGAIALFEEAVAIDSAFAMAWRKMAVARSNYGAPTSSTAEAATQAFVHRDRLPPVERLNAEAFYYSVAEYDQDRVIEVYRRILDRDPEDAAAVNNLPRELIFLGRFVEAVPILRGGLENDPNAPTFNNLVVALVGMGDLQGAYDVVADGAQFLPEGPVVPYHQAFIPGVERDYATVDSAMREFLDAGQTSPAWVWWGHEARATAAQAMGRLEAAQRHHREAMAVDEARGLLRAEFGGLYYDAVESALVDLRYRGDTAAAIAAIEGLLTRVPFDDRDPVDRPYVQLARFFAEAGDIERARAFTDAFGREVTPELQTLDWDSHTVRGLVARADGDTTAAIAHFRVRLSNQVGTCSHCGVFELATTFDAMGKQDSALAYYHRIADQPGLWAQVRDHAHFAPSFLRLGEIYEERGDRDRSIEYYNEFVQLWEHADPELQPQVADVRARIARLIGEGRT